MAMEKSSSNNIFVGWEETGRSMDEQPQKTSIGELIAALKQCSRTRDLEGGKRLHLKAVAAGCHTDKYVATGLVRMYTKCRSLSVAREVFDGMTRRDVVTWNCLILGHVENGESSLAMDLFTRMDCEPNSVTYIAVLKSCASLATHRKLEKQTFLHKGLFLHGQLKCRGFDSKINVASTLLDMYGKCGSMKHAQKVFDEMIRKDAVTWTCLMMGYVENGECSVALELFESMDCEPDRATYIAVLKACTSLATERESKKQVFLEKGIAIHRQLKDRGLSSETLVASTLLDMYGKCYSMELAREVFDGMVRKDVVSWACLLHGYLENGEASEAMDLFTSMDCEPNPSTYVAALKACAGLAREGVAEKQVLLEKGMTIHSRLKERGFDSDIVLANALLDTYGKCGSMRHAQDVFDGMVRKDVVTWTSMVLGYVHNGESLVALELFTRMDCEPDHVTYTAALKACAALAHANESRKHIYLQRGISIHRQLEGRVLDSNIGVSNSLLNMYGKCGSMRHARQVFDGMVHKDVVTWSCLMAGYVENGESSVAMDLFTSMDCEPDCIAYIAALKACVGVVSEKPSSKQFYLEKGIDIHRRLKDDGFDSNTVLAGTLLDMYGKCGSMRHAQEVFKNMTHKDVIAWTSLIQGYVENGDSSVALGLFTSMDCEPDHGTYVAALKACEISSDMPLGQLIHARVCQLGYEQDQVLATALVDLYGKCGRVDMAQILFNGIHNPNIVCWTALIAGYTSLGQTSHVFCLTQTIREAGLQMNGITLVCILAACSQAGLLDKAKMYFEAMPSYGITRTPEHYTCMVDMLGRANRLDEALSVVNSMPCEADTVTWMTLLGACRKWKNLQVGKVAFDALVAANTRDSSAYVLMSDIYGSLSMWQNQEEILKTAVTTLH